MVNMFIKIYSKIYNKLITLTKIVSIITLYKLNFYFILHRVKLIFFLSVTSLKMKSNKFEFLNLLFKP